MTDRTLSLDEQIRRFGDLRDRAGHLRRGL